MCLFNSYNVQTHFFPLIILLSTNSHLRGVSKPVIMWLLISESRAESLDEAAKASKEFDTDCNQMLNWIQNTVSSVKEAPALTPDYDLLQKLAAENKVGETTTHYNEFYFFNSNSKLSSSLLNVIDISKCVWFTIIFLSKS